MRDSKGYIESILKNVRFKEAHSEIEKEIQTHMDELAETFSSIIKNKDELQNEVIRRMGDPNELGKKLDSIHRPQIDWMIVIQVGVLIVSGLTIMAAQGFLGRHLLWAAIGAIVAVIIVLRKPKLSGKASLIGFLGIAGITILSFFSTTYANGQPYLSIAGLNIKIVDLSAALFTIFAPGVLLFGRKGKTQTAVSYLLLASPIWIFLKTGSVFPAAGYGVAVLGMMTVYSASIWPTLSVSCLSALGIFLLPEMNRFAESGSLEALRQSEQHTDFVMTALHSLSPTISVVAALCAILFCTRLFSVAKAIKSFQGKMAVIGIACFISLGVLWSLISNLGFAPMPTAGVNFPFVSYGGSMMIAQLAMIGFVLSYYRRKNLSDFSTAF